MNSVQADDVYRSFRGQRVALLMGLEVLVAAARLPPERPKEVDCPSG
jgi:hypothetical protein